MAFNRWVFVLLAMCAVTVVLAVEEEPRAQPTTKAPIAHGSDKDLQEDDFTEESFHSANWVPCNFTGHFNLACQDCNTRLICLSVGGLLAPCKNPKRPNCNHGLCSATPSAHCSGKGA